MPLLPDLSPHVKTYYINIFEKKKLLSRDNAEKYLKKIYNKF